MNRDWKSIDNRLVGHGMLLLSVDFLENWGKQLAELNSGTRLENLSDTRRV